MLFENHWTISELPYKNRSLFLRNRSIRQPGRSKTVRSLFHYVGEIMGGSVSEESTGGPTSSGPVLEVIVLAAEDLKNVNMVGKMSVYVVAWLENDCKRSTSVRHKTGRNAVWNDALSFPVTDDILLNPHSALTVQVYSTGTVSPSVVGTTYLALTDIARMKATKTNSEEGDLITLPLHRRSGRTQGRIGISVNLTGATIQQMMYALDKGHDGWSIEMPTSFSGIPDGVAVMGYPAVQPYGTPASFYPPCTDYDDDHTAFLPSAPPLSLAAPVPEPCLTLNPDTQVSETTPPPARPPPPLPTSSPFFSNNSNVDPHPCAQARNQYIPVQIRRQQEGRENFLVALISGVGGVVGGLVLGDIISAAL